MWNAQQKPSIGYWMILLWQLDEELQLEVAAIEIFPSVSARHSDGEIPIIYNQKYTIYR